MSTEQVVVPPVIPMLPVLRVRGKSQLACPYCKAKGLDNFMYVEDVVNMRELISLKKGLLLIQSHYDVADEGGHNPRLVCKECDQDCDIPENLDLDWI